MKKYLVLTLIAILALVISGCSVSTPAPTASPSATSSPKPTFTPTPTIPVAQIELEGDEGDESHYYYCNGCWTGHSRFEKLNEISFDGKYVRIYPKGGERLPQNIKVQLTGQRWKPDLGDYINYSALGLERGNNSWDNEVKTIIEGHLTQGGSLSQNGYRIVYQGNELRIHLADNYSDAFKAVPWKRVTLKIFNETRAEVGRYVFKEVQIGFGNCAITDKGGIFPRVESAFGQCVWWALWRKWEEEWKPDNSKMIQNPNFYPPTGGKLIEAQKWQPQRFDIIVLYKASDDGHYAFVEKVEDYWRSDGVFYKKLTISQFNLKKINDCTEVYSEDVIYWRPDREKVAFTKNTEGAPIYYMGANPDNMPDTWKWYYVGPERPPIIIPPAPLTSEEKALIQEYGLGGDYVVRWPDGDIGVYDATGNTTIRAAIQRALNEWNAVIKSGGGKTRFYLSSDSSSPVKIFYDPSLSADLCASANHAEEGHEITSFELKITTSNLECDFPNTYYAILLKGFGHMAGMNYKKTCPGGLDPDGSCPREAWTQYTSIPDVHKKVVRALYKVSPGYYVGN